MSKDISIVQIKIWVGDLYIGNKMLEDEVVILKKENDNLKAEIDRLKKERGL